jgi:hypothetical protein
MPRLRFEPTIPVFQRAKTVHALDLATTVITVFIVILKVIKFLILNIQFLTDESERQIWMGAHTVSELDMSWVKIVKRAVFFTYEFYELW